MKVTGIEELDGGNVIKVTLKGGGKTHYEDVSYIYVPADGNIPSFGQQFDLVAIPFIEKVPA